jgi:hypothetical protein
MIKYLIKDENNGVVFIESDIPGELNGEMSFDTYSAAQTVFSENQDKFPAGEYHIALSVTE